MEDRQPAFRHRPPPPPPASGYEDLSGEHSGSSAQTWSVPVAFTSRREDHSHPTGQDGLICELKTYEIHHDSKGESTILQAGTKRKAQQPEDLGSDSALVLKRYYDQNKLLTSTELVIRSPHIKAALRDVIKCYPGMTLFSNDIVIRDKPKCLFHFRNELRDYGRDLVDEVAIAHLKFLLAHMNRVLDAEMRSYYRCMESPHVEPGLEFDFLWMVFRPGDLLYLAAWQSESVIELIDMEKAGSSWKIRALDIYQDGTSYKRRLRTKYIHAYEGYMPLECLDIYPLDFHPRYKELEERFRARGVAYMHLHGFHHRYYKGPAYEISSTSSRQGPDELDCPQTQMQGEVVIDNETFYQLFPSFRGVAYGDSAKEVRGWSIEESIGLMTDFDFMKCPIMIPGFCLASKKWFFLYVEEIKDAVYSKLGFDSLILPDQSKKLVTALIKVQLNPASAPTRISVTKRKGIVMLFHGGPGRGKTSAAETIASFIGRSVYKLSGGDFGTEIPIFEERLRRAFDFATRWKMLLVFEDSDVIFNTRQDDEMQRRVRVSVFRKLLENYQGIMILMTTHVDDLDPAIRSQVNLAIKFPRLDSSARLEIWKAFLQDEIDESYTSEWSERRLRPLAKLSMNGHQIKNAVYTARALAEAENRALRREDISVVLGTLPEFDHDSVDHARIWDDDSAAAGATTSSSKRKHPSNNGDETAGSRKRYSAKRNGSSRHWDDSESSGRWRI